LSYRSTSSPLGSRTRIDPSTAAPIVRPAATSSAVNWSTTSGRTLDGPTIYALAPTDVMKRAANIPTGDPCSPVRIGDRRPQFT
jgi:hypothetical protein